VNRLAKWLLPLVLGLAVACAVQAQMYKCTDARGATRYTDQPCAGGRGGAVDIRGQPPISGKLAPGAPDLGREERDFRQRQIERGRREEADTRAREQAQRRCANLRASLANYSAARRIVQIDAKGERTYMSDAAREARIAQLNAEIAQNCP
jgi:hypothetical protein